MPLTNFTTNILPFYATNVANGPNYEAPGNFGLPTIDVGGTPLASATLGASGGTTYATSATFTVTVAGGTLSAGASAATVSVTTNSSGVVTTVNGVVNAGLYSVLPTTTNNIATGGAGSGLELNLVFNTAATASAQKLLTLVEVLRSLIAETTGPSQLRDIHEVLRKMMMTMKWGGPTTYSASSFATKAQSAALNYIAKNPTHSP